MGRKRPRLASWCLRVFCKKLQIHMGSQALCSTLYFTGPYLVQPLAHWLSPVSLPSSMDKSSPWFCGSWTETPLPFPYVLVISSQRSSSIFWTSSHCTVELATLLLAQWRACGATPLKRMLVFTVPPEQGLSVCGGTKAQGHTLPCPSLRVAGDLSILEGHWSLPLCLESSWKRKNSLMP